MSDDTPPKSSEKPTTEKPATEAVVSSVAAVSPADRSRSPDAPREARGGEGRNSEGRGNEGPTVAVLMTKQVPTAAANASAKLKELITGTLAVETSDTRKRFSFDWTQTPVVCAEGGTSATPPDCTIRISERDLLQVARGDLNPQIAMLSDKITVTGKTATALYFFNLVAPRSL